MNSKLLLKLAKSLIILLLLVVYLWQNNHTTSLQDSKNPQPVKNISEHSKEIGPQQISMSSLPREALKTLNLIKSNGPFPYERDGIVFGNYEGLLPRRKKGYYREYTVKTPGRSDRGERRIVMGDNDEIYYSEDHYKSFKRIIIIQ